MDGKSKSYRVMGIDPGLHVTGYAIMDFNGHSPSIVEAGTICTNPRDATQVRVQQLHADLAEILDQLRPDVAGLEQLYAHYRHPRTAILMAHARGVVMLACQQANVNVKHLAATHVKKSLTGNGRASKTQMQRSIQALFKLKALPEPPDVADAIAIALCAGRGY